MVVLKNLYFNKGLVFLDNIQVYMCPLNYFLTVVDYNLKNNSENEFRDLVRQISKVDMRILFEELNGISSNKKKIIDLFLSKINLLGFGKLSLKLFREGELLFIQRNPHLGVFYEQIFGVKPMCRIEEFICGFIENFLSCLFKKNVVCKIEEKQQHLLYKIKFVEGDFENSELLAYPTFVKEGMSLAVKKILLNEGFEVDRGMFKMTGMTGFLVPYFMLFELIKCCENRNKLNIFLKSLGLMQGKAAVDMHHHFGVDYGDGTFMAVLNILDISGIGAVKVLSEDNTELLLFDNIFSFFFKFYSDDVLEILRNHFLNIYLGIYTFSYNKFVKFEVEFGNRLIFRNIMGRLKLSCLDEKISKSLTTKTLMTNSS